VSALDEPVPDVPEDPARISPEPPEWRPLQQIAREYVLEVLRAMGGNKTRAAAVLGIDRRTMYRWVDATPGGRQAFIRPMQTPRRKGDGYRRSKRRTPQAAVSA